MKKILTILSLICMLLAVTACSPNGNENGIPEDDVLTTEIPENTVENLPEINTTMGDKRLGQTKEKRAEYLTVMLSFFDTFTNDDANIINFITEGTEKIYNGNNIRIERKSTYLDITLYGYGSDYEDGGYLKFYGNAKMENSMFSKDWMSDGTGGLLTANVIVLDNTFHSGKGTDLYSKQQISIKAEQNNNNDYKQYVYEAYLNGEDLTVSLSTIFSE